MRKLYLLTLPLLLTACPGTNDFFGTPGQGAEGSLNETLTGDYSASNATPKPPQQKDLIYAGPRYYIGDPYKVEDVPYTPAEDFNYNQSGIAGIVPVDLNGTPTTNGEKFDTNAMVATSKTLPLPSLVRVTNLDNNQSATLRVNNRGPFVNSRLMDVSPAAARKLGMTGQTNVQVKILKTESQMIKDMTMGVPVTMPTDAPEEAQIPTTTPTPPATTGTRRVSVPATAATVLETGSDSESAGGQYTVQAGAYYSEHSADAIASRFTDFGDVRIVQEGGMFKIRFLNLSAEEAKRIIERLRTEGNIDRPGIIRNGVWLNPSSI